MRVTTLAMLTTLCGCTAIRDYFDYGDEQPNLSVLAGAIGGAGWADDTGTKARFSNPQTLLLDGNTLYVADYGNGLIRQVAVDSKVVTTLTGNHGTSGGDGARQVANVSSPNGIAKVGGFLYVADYTDNTIRQVDVTNGYVETIAGTHETSGESSTLLTGPQGLTTDGTLLYFTEGGGNCVRSVTLSNPTVAEVAGTCGSATGSSDGAGGDASFYAPRGIAFDSATNALYVADAGNSTIRKIDLGVSPPMVSTLAGLAAHSGFVDGTGDSARFSGPTDLVTDGSGTLYVTDANNHIVRTIDLASRLVTTVAGLATMSGSTDGVGSAARFYFPSGLALAGTTLYVAEAGNDQIRKIDLSTFSVSSLAGFPGNAGYADASAAEARFSDPIGITADTAGNLYVADRGSCVIRKVTIDGGKVSTLAGSVDDHCAHDTDGGGASALFSDVWGVTYDQGFLYVSEAESCIVRRISLADDSVRIVGGIVGQCATWMTHTDGALGVATFGPTESLSADGAGNLFIVDRSSESVRKLELSSGIVSTPSYGFSFYEGEVVSDKMGSLYVASHDSEQIWKIDVASATSTVLAGTINQRGYVDGADANALFYLPESIEYDGQGNLFIGDYGNSLIRKINLASGDVTTIAGALNHGEVETGALPASINDPAGMVFAGGNLFIADRSENAVLRLHP